MWASSNISLNNIEHNSSLSGPLPTWPNPWNLRPSKEFLPNFKSSQKIENHPHEIWSRITGLHSGGLQTQYILPFPSRALSQLPVHIPSVILRSEPSHARHAPPPLLNNIYEKFLAAHCTGHSTCHQSHTRAPMGRQTTTTAASSQTS